jgi:hypothetical protein
LDAVLLLSVQLKGLTVAQFPNAPLALWGAASIVASLTSDEARDVAEIVAVAGLLWWALEELLRGVNWFRRGLGGVVAAVTVAGLVLAV